MAGELRGVDPLDLPFQQAIRFFRGKLNIPTERWTDLWRTQHRSMFMVAGAASHDLLEELRGLVDEAIAEGITIEEFRAGFDAIVERSGWQYHGGRDWRTRVIYDTNVRMAYSAGRWRQLTDPELLADRPFLLYRHGDSANPRPEHQAWDGLVLPADDPWWHTHYPPNGWGCSCRVFAASQADLARLGKAGPDTAPAIERYPWTNPGTGLVEMIPMGIDPGFDYNVGMAA